MGERHRYDEVQAWLVTLAETLATEWDFLVSRLQVEREPIFDEYDRLRAEAELRFSLLGPLLMLTVTMSATWHSWE